MTTGRNRRLFSSVAILVFVIIFFAGCSSSSNPGDPPAPGSVTGVVRDMDTGAVIPGALISDGTTTVSANSSGVFTLTKTAGACTLNASATGYVTTFRVSQVVSAATTTIDWSLTKSPGDYWDYSDTTITAPKVPADGMDYVIMAWNDLGMHCAQDDYSYFLILPPFNTLHAQVIKRGGGIVTTGVTVKYAFPKKTDSTLHTNFWTYASAYDLAGKYGWNVTPNAGITGTPLAGDMTLDSNGLGFVATGIPITPYDDDGAWDPYGTAILTLVDSLTGSVLQTATVVAPISTELNCANCHGSANPFLNILQMHDKHNGTSLVADQAAGTPHLCAECHADNALGLPGKAGVENLSLAMHNFHKDKMNTVADPKSPDCYNCHPGPKTNCLRGNMFHAGIECKDCHGDMTEMAAALKNGRKPWLEEPKCASCHGAQYAENADTLYRNSVMLNSPDTMNMPSKMNGKIYCEACHNSTHAEFRSTNPADGSIPMQFQGDNYWIWNCYVCHTDYMPSPSMHLPY